MALLPTLSLAGISCNLSTEEKLVDEVAMRIIEGTIKPGDVVTPKVKSDKIVL
jgi:hypothetical protein